MHRRTFIASLSALALPSFAHADCVLLEHKARFVTRSGAAIPPDGGVLVTLTAIDRSGHAGDPFGGEWALVVGTRRTALRMTAIAPGLRRLELPRNAPVAVHIESPIGPLDVTRGESIPLLEQPAIRGVYLPSAGPFSVQPSPSVTLVRQVPAGAIAAVLRRYVGPTPTPTLFGRAQVGALSLTLNDLGRCAPPFPGAVVPSIGTRVDLVYVDAFGRISAPSGAVRFNE